MTAPASRTLVRRLRAVLRSFGIDFAPYNQHNGDYVVLDAIRRRSIATVLDVGANRGQFAQWLTDYGFRGQIHLFEPLPEAYAALNAAGAGRPGWIAHEYALAAREGEAVLNVGRNDETSSLQSVAKDDAAKLTALEVVDKLTVRTRRLDNVLAECRIDPARAFLKIDAQGGEAAVLEGAGDAVNKFPLIQLETAIAPLYDGETQLAPMIAYFRARGFVVRGVRPVYFHPSNRELMQVDLIVERP